jgi:soluble lytic murein transglycosylase-like protein
MRRSPPHRTSLTCSAPGPGGGAQLAAARAALAEARSGAGPIWMPAGYRRAYRAAAGTCPGMRWTLLAAVGQVESGHGRNPGPSSAGAIGPMQFMPATFASYGEDGDHDGRTDAWDPEDAIFSAARYLCASGAGGGSDRGVHDALLTYNHAEWYVQLVLDAEAGIIAGQ